MRRFIEAGEEARFVDELPLKLVIIDESIVMFGMEDPVAERRRAELTIMVVEHPSLASVLKIAFNAVWEQGLTFDEAYERFVVQRRQTALASLLLRVVAADDVDQVERHAAVAAARAAPFAGCGQRHRARRDAVELRAERRDAGVEARPARAGRRS